MINSFQALDSITSGLRLIELEENINATNLSNPSIDSQGYLMNSLQQVNSVTNPSINVDGANGVFSVGTGASLSSVTRLRSSYLDSQIQQASFAVGYDEILSNSNSTGVVDQANSIVNGSTTLSSTLSAFATAWNNLAANPTSTALQSAVVNAGEAFANEGNREYDAIQSLQTNVNDQIGQTVSQINGYLSQLATINGQLGASGSANSNNLLDERDYTLDKLSRLMNYQVNYSSDGQATVWLGGVMLVSGSQAGTLQTNLSDPNYPQMADITVNFSGGTYAAENSATSVTTDYDLTSDITGGNLGGELYGRNVILQSYKQQIDQVVTSTLNATNALYSAGYVYNSSTTGINFFSGYGAGNITVNSVLTNGSPTAPFLATEISPNNSTASPVTTVGYLATILSNLPNLLGNSYVASSKGINATGKTVSASASLASQIPPATVPSDFPTTPTGGTFTVNGVTITYTTASSIDSILNSINTSVPNVYAVFNSTTQEFSFYSTGSVTIANGTSNFTTWAKTANYLVSSFNINTLQQSDTDIVFGGANSALNSSVSNGFVNGVAQGANQQAFTSTPGVSGSYTLNGTVIAWNDTQSLQTIKTNMLGASGVTAINFVGQQQWQIVSSTPISMYDNTGNLTAFLGLNGSVSLGNLASNLTTNASAQDSNYNSSYTSASNSLTQLNNAQDNLAGASGTYTVNGTTQTVGSSATATIEQQSYQDMIQYNAMLEVMQVIDQMLDSLVGITSSTSTNGIFQQQSQS